LDVNVVGEKAGLELNMLLSKSRVIKRQTLAITLQKDAVTSLLDVQM
jgi:hypothetical protein